MVLRVYTESMWGKVTAIASAALLVVGGAGVAVHEVRASHAQQQACVAVDADLRKTTDARHDLSARNSTDSTLVVGDSYSAGQWLEDPSKGWAFELANSAPGRWDIDASGGSGFVNAGPCGGRTFLDILEKHDNAHYTTVILQGGINDLAADHEARAAREAMRFAARHADNVVVIGSFAPPGVDAGRVRSTNEQLRTVASAEGASFIDPSSWEYHTLPDKVHPTTAGHAAIAEKVRAVLGDSSRQS